MAIGRPLEKAEQHRKGDQKEVGEKNNVELLNLIVTVPKFTPMYIHTGIRVRIM